MSINPNFMIKVSAMNTEHKTAVWVLTRGGLIISEKLKQKKEGCVFFVSERFEAEICDVSFLSLRKCVAENFHRYSGHVFIMATGIVIRMIADHLKDKTIDPAVVSLDDTGAHVISLLSGHLGGANELALEIADLIGAEPVLSTATDMNRVPSIDMIAKERNLTIENPEMIKTVNMAFLEGEKVSLYDPCNLLSGVPGDVFKEGKASNCQVMVDDHIYSGSHNMLLLRPPTLSVGIGCNRGTPMLEIMDLIKDVFIYNGLSLKSIKHIATIDIKKDEDGILETGKNLGVHVVYFKNSELDVVEQVKNSSQIVKKHTGAKSVCEAAAILASVRGELIVEKQKTKNVTLAVARRKNPSMSSE